MITAAGLLVLGVSLPSLSVNQLLLFEERLSVLTGLRILWAEGEWGLAGVVVSAGSDSTSAPSMPHRHI